MAEREKVADTCAACDHDGPTVPGAFGRVCLDAKRCIERACPKRTVHPLNGERRRTAR